MPLARPLTYGLFVLWVSVCAFAPEAIWQGFLLIGSHFGVAEAGTALCIGALLAFFVEPLAERAKAGRWRVHHMGGGLLANGLLSLAVGFAVVCVHDAMLAFFGGAHAAAEAKPAGLAHALDQALQWALVPALVSSAWLVATESRRFGYCAAGVACVASAGVGWLFDWSWPVVVTTTVVCSVIAVLGTRTVLIGRGGRGNATPASLVLVAPLAGFAALWLIQAALAWLGGRDVPFYSAAQTWEDLRFYLGWFVGLSVAPDPTSGWLSGHARPSGGRVL